MCRCRSGSKIGWPSLSSSYVERSHSVFRGNWYSSNLDVFWYWARTTTKKCRNSYNPKAGAGGAEYVGCKRALYWCKHVLTVCAYPQHLTAFCAFRAKDSMDWLRSPWLSFLSLLQYMLTGTGSMTTNVCICITAVFRCDS